MPEEVETHTPDHKARIEEVVDEPDANAKFYLCDEDDEPKANKSVLGELMEIKDLHESTQSGMPKSYSSESLISYLIKNNKFKAKSNDINKLKMEIVDLYNKSNCASGTTGRFQQRESFVNNLGKQIKELDEMCGRNKEKLESLESKKKGNASRNKFLLSELEGLLNDSNKLNVENKKISLSNSANSMSATSLIKYKLDHVNISTSLDSSNDAVSKKKNFNLYNSSKLSPNMNSELIKTMTNTSEMSENNNTHEAMSDEDSSSEELTTDKTLQKNVFITNFDKILIKKTQEEPDYVRGRGRGKFLCVECGIRKKKLCELKKHLFTHAKYRPFMCTRCRISFKTKGNLVKHVKTKAHLRRCVDMGMKADDEMITKITLENIDNNLLSRQLEIDKKVRVSRTDFNNSNNDGDL
jgi:hypothetical protein